MYDVLKPFFSLQIIYEYSLHIPQQYTYQQSIYSFCCVICSFVILIVSCSVFAAYLVLYLALGVGQLVVYLLIWLFAMVKLFVRAGYCCVCFNLWQLFTLCFTLCICIILFSLLVCCWAVFRLHGVLSACVLCKPLCLDHQTHVQCVPNHICCKTLLLIKAKIMYSIHNSNYRLCCKCAWTLVDVLVTAAAFNVKHRLHRSTLHYYVVTNFLFKHPV